MKIAVITPYYKESTNILKRCHDSILNQTHSDITHIMLSDGYPNEEIDNWDKVMHVRLPHTGDYGDTPRAIGGILAASHGFDALLLLDADNWFEPTHVEIMKNIHVQYNTEIVTCTRTLRRLDESVMAVCAESDGKAFNDTNCFFLSKNVFHLMNAWAYKNPKEGIVGDRYFWDAVVKSGLSRAHCPTPTVNYVTTFAFHYLVNKEVVPDHAKIITKLADQEHSTMHNYNELNAAMEELKIKGKVSYKDMTLITKNGKIVIS